MVVQQPCRAEPPVDAPMPGTGAQILAGLPRPFPLQNLHNPSDIRCSGRHRLAAGGGADAPGIESALLDSLETLPFAQLPGALQAQRLKELHERADADADFDRAHPA